MTKLRKVVAGGLGFCVLAMVFLLHADNAPAEDSPQTRKHAQGGTQKIYSQLNVTQLQEQQLEANKQEHRAKMKSARQQKEVDIKALQQELMKPQLDMNKINEIENRLKALEAQIADDRLKSVLAVRTILTPQQFQEFITLMHKNKTDHAKAEEREVHE